MSITRQKLEELIKQENFTEIFLYSGLGWDQAERTEPLPIEFQFAETSYKFDINYVAQKRGFIVCVTKSDEMPTKVLRQKLERELSKVHYEHILILTAKNGEQKWMISRKLEDKPIRLFEVGFVAEQMPEAIIQKLNGLAFSMSEERTLGIVDVSVRALDAFAMNAEEVTRQFYEKFRYQLVQFQDFIRGLQAQIDKEQYAALMLNRLMFIYFIQKKNFLDNDVNYLKTRLLRSKKELGKNKYYQGFYRHFLINLFHRGLDAPIESRTKEIKDLIGKVPYLNGGLFDQHALEKEYGADIKIADDAFEKLFEFFDKYNWYLDNSPIASGKDINPDVIGYIFEKYINERAKMGAYYTQEDVTGYIARNTILPYLLQQVKKKCAEAFDKENGTIWNLLKNSPEKYIYDDARFGCNIEDNKIPPEIISGGGGGGGGVMRLRPIYQQNGENGIHPLMKSLLCPPKLGGKLSLAASVFFH